MTALASELTLDFDWLRQLEESVPAYLAALRVSDNVGRYLPCLRGATPVGREMALGWSCFALKLHFMLGAWKSLPALDRSGWIQFLQSFQKNDGENPFVDPPEVAFLDTYVPWRERLKGWFKRGQTTKSAHAITLAETKQAIATFTEIGAEPLRTFSGFPSTPAAVQAWLKSQDWSRPWGAGGQSAGLVVFIKTQAPKFLAPRPRSRSCLTDLPRIFRRPRRSRRPAPISGGSRTGPRRIDQWRDEGAHGARLA